MCWPIFMGPGPATGGDEGWSRVDGPCGFEFPKDHGSHEGYRTEWWYYTGNLATETGRNFGFQLTFFRRGLVPGGATTANGPEKTSAWRARQVYLAHFAITDLEIKNHLMAQKMARANLGLAGIRPEGQGFYLFLENWSADIQAHGHLLKAQTPGFSLDLQLTPVKDPVAHGQKGYSLKGSRPDRASCYYSFTRLSAKGRVEVENQSFSVSGRAWMDHEYSTALLEPDIKGWDWFGLQLSDHTEIMLFFLRKKDGTLSPTSSGTFVPQNGAPVHLALGDVTAMAEKTWKSRETGAEYPIAWTLKIPRANLNLTVTAPVEDQEMSTSETTGVTYWEGSVAVTGAKGKTPVSGKGYVELTGYAGKGFEADL